MGPAGGRPEESWVADLEFERPGRLRRALRAGLTNHLANHFPAGVLRAFLRLMRSELAQASWADPGGWQSMVISYDARPRRLADKLLCALGTVPMALRNRRRLAARVLARLIDACDREPVEVLCLGAGPGHIITDALRECRRRVRATLVDLSSAAHDYGRRLAAANAPCHEVRFIQGDVRDVAGMLDRPPDVVKMIGICEYLPDESLRDIAGTVARAMPPGAALVFNSLSDAHGTDRFFRGVMGLEMIHRTPDQLQDLLRPAGFGDFAALLEPLGVYHVVIGRKGQTPGPPGT